MLESANFMKTVLRHIEFWSAITCLLFMALVPLIFHILGIPDAINLILTLIVASAAQLILLRFVHQRNRVIQQKTVDQVREMLRDRVLNHLAIISLQVQHTNATQNQFNRIRQAITAIETDVSQLSSKTLEDWLNSYQNVTDLDDTQVLKKMVVPAKTTKSA